jgi:hypothetical protein
MITGVDGLHFLKEPTLPGVFVNENGQRSTRF